MNSKMHYATIDIVKIKVDEDARKFRAYGNAKFVIDHVKDRTIDGTFQYTIDWSKETGNMPLQLWSHDTKELPVGPITSIGEDDVGFWIEGKLSQTTMGNDIYQLALDGALKSFSIGYVVIKEKWNSDLGCNDLLSVWVKEVSWVNFACNEASLLQEVKSKMENNKLPTQRELKKLLQENCDMSSRQADKIAGKYNDSEKLEVKYDEFCEWCAYDYDVLTMTLEYHDPEIHGKLYAGALVTKLDRAGFDAVSALFDDVDTMKGLVDAIASSGNGKVNEVLLSVLSNQQESKVSPEISALIKECANMQLFKSIN